MQTFWPLFVRLLEKFCTFVAKKNTKCKYVKMKKIFKTLIIIGSIALVSLTLYFSYDHFVVNKEYKENEVIQNGDLKYIVNNSYVTNLNKYGEVISKDNTYIIIDFTNIVW